ncbi:Fe-S cluster biogenesis protein NfuA/nitrite reductase/ring-hydroxylating ferredoxin subunit [Rhodococcus sp. PvR099]|nr:Fe-S cluster biogenesis protein NfuA/nitrite reductase/ring-hydroxylating ferredoxin subunit [Rhodococcus sp. PvR099]PTR38577.1 Fe-S cluster biogenesis protein NfuA [Rhodococcus sp. OK611]SNX92948.1 Fe-S cluster biogenesis protein NfuA, 4Fe-4S-binding domain [Rhodococcus sp. OK270]
MNGEAAGDEEARWRAAGDRIETLLEASSAGGTVARERAEQLVREVVDLYGEGLARVVRILGEHVEDGAEWLADDDLVASLLLVHGLHPHDVPTRVCAALDSVRPYLGSHGGDVELMGIEFPGEGGPADGGGVVRLELTGSCRSCPSSSVTLELAVEGAVLAAAPEIASIEVVAAQPGSEPGLIAAESLFSHVHAPPGPAGTWCPAPELEQLAPGEVGGFVVGGLPILVCRIGDDLLAYRDRCPSCTHSLAGAVLARRAGHAAGDAVLRCPTCRAHFDVVHAGAGLDDGDVHLEPLPVLVRDGVRSVAVPVGVSG